MAKGQEEIDQALHLGLYSFLVNDRLDQAFSELECLVEERYR